MPISIYNSTDMSKIIYLCDNEWDLPSQIDSLKEWLIFNASSIPKSEYIADIGFDVRKNASGGGAVIESKTLKLLGEMGIELHFSEYPGMN